MRNKTLVILVVILSFFKIFIATAQEAGPPKTIEYIVNADSANLRSGPGTSFGSAGKVAKGERLLIYDETPETAGWLRIYRPGEDDAFIADFLVERAPLRFYTTEQEPILEVSGHGKGITDVYDIPKGAYRIDVNAKDNAFILKTTVVEGDCEDDTIFNELNLNSRSISVSGLFVSQGCSVIFETDNVDGDWGFAVRDIIVSAEFVVQNALRIDDDSSIPGSGRQLTMPTFLSEGIWKINATVDDNAFILKAQVLTGDCENGSVFNEFEISAKSLDISTVYRSPKEGCIIFWETSNVDEDWEIIFEKVR